MNNRNGDLLDEGLQAVMGKDRCQNVWQPETKKSTPRKNAEQEKPKAAIAEPMDAEYVKLNVVSPMARLKCCAKWALLFGSISTLLFYWQQAGLLDPKAAVPSLIICALVGGLTIGWHAR